MKISTEKPGFLSLVIPEHQLRTLVTRVVPWPGGMWTSMLLIRFHTLMYTTEQIVAKKGEGGTIHNHSHTGTATL